MSFLKITSPHGHGPLTTAGIMQTVLLATLPGVAVMTWFFGPGTLINLLFGGALALAFEAAALRLRDRNPGPYLRDYSVLVTSTLLCIALPPYSPWWLVATGIFSSVILGKHVFGGLGYNPFNPAMVGYVILLISFPLQMSTWQAPRGLDAVPGVVDALEALLLPARYDAITMATPLDVLRQNQGLLMADLQAQKPQFGRWAGVGWEWINLAFLAGGLWLLFKRVFTWHAPVGLLAALGFAPQSALTVAARRAGGHRCFTG